jgi:hypothetical protein
MGLLTTDGQTHAFGRSGRPARARTARRYQLILLNDERETAEVETARELGLGDDVEVRGTRYEIVGLVWKKSGEHLLCRRRPGSRPTDEPIAQEKTWWSTAWQ